MAEKNPQKSTLQAWMDDGVPCYYSKFQSPVPPSKEQKRNEPVYEFHLAGGVKRDPKYLVDSMTYTPHGLIWTLGDEIDITPLPNVVHSRIILGSSSEVEHRTVNANVLGSTPSFPAKEKQSVN